MSVINHVKKIRVGGSTSSVCAIVQPKVEIDGEVRTVLMNGHATVVDDYLPSNLDKQGVRMSEREPENFRQPDSFESFDYLENIADQYSARASRSEETKKNEK